MQRISCDHACCQTHWLSFYIHVLWQEPVLTLTEQQHAVGEEFKVLVVVTYRTMQMFLTCPFGSWQRISNLVLPFEDLCWEQLFTEGKGNWKLGAWGMCVESSADPQKESSLHLCSLAWAGICDCWVINDLNKFQQVVKIVPCGRYLPKVHSLRDRWPTHGL